MADVEDNAENLSICLDNCGSCPSYPGDREEALYCARGPSSQQVDKKGCNCPECPLWINCGLSAMYYCMKR